MQQSKHDAIVLDAAVPLRTFCIAHVAPLYPLGKHATICAMDDIKGAPIRGPVLECSAQLRRYDAVLQHMGQIPGLFAIRDYLKANLDDLSQPVQCLTYRVFILPFETENKDAEIGLNFVKPKELAPLEKYIAPIATRNPWYLPRPFFVHSIESHYQANHMIDDFLLFLECAIKVGVIDHQQALECRRNVLFLPTAASGRMPADVFCQITDQMELTTNRFLEVASFGARGAYQVKFVQFCYERLANYLTERALRKHVGGLDARCFGHWTMVSETGTYQPGQVKTRRSKR